MAYVWGISISGIYIRSRRVVGAGFFWMLSIVNSVLVFLSCISSSGLLRVLGWFSLVSILALLAYVLVMRDYLKNKAHYVEVILTSLACVSVAIFLVGAAHDNLSQWPFIRETFRLFLGGSVLGGITTAMLLGHWYLVQPGLTRKPIGYMCIACIVGVICETLMWLVPPSMISVLSGSTSDGWGGTLGYMWVGSALTTLGLVYVARRALMEKSYSAVMATTGLLYLAILVANGTELIPRAIFS